jgi:hypothetical protein
MNDDRRRSLLGGHAGRSVVGDSSSISNFYRLDSGQGGLDDWMNEMHCKL